ncbi:unnamed protein product, partial [Iphiclides podalirius]
MNLRNRYIFFIQYIVTRFVPQATSVKTYEVRRLNGSSYIVTSFPEYDYGNSKGVDLSSNAKVIFMDDEKKVMKAGHSNTGCANTTVTVGGNITKNRYKMSAKAIKEARERYFKTFFATMKKTTTTANFNHSAPSAYLSWNDPDVNVKGASVQMKENLQNARKFASLLIFELQKRDNDPLKVMDSTVKRKRSRK